MTVIGSGGGLLAALILFAAAGASDSQAQRGREQASGSLPVHQPISVASRRLSSFDRSGLNSTKRFGRLEFLGGLVLSSEDKRFGGLSGLIMAPDGRRLLAVTDEGHSVSARVEYDGRVPKGLTDVRIAPILGLNGGALVRKRDSDAEALTLLSGTFDNGVALVAFERNHRIARHLVIDGKLGRATGHLKLPDRARSMPSNGGIEAMTVLAGGRHKGSILVFAEEWLSRAGHHTGWLIGAGPTREIYLEERGGFAVTGAASLADGSVVILERRYRALEGVKMQLRQVAADDIRPGAVLKGETLISVDMTKEIDNMEGIAVHQGPRGETVLTVVSDDNFNRLLQRSILLQFLLHPPDAGGRRSGG